MGTLTVEYLKPGHAVLDLRSDRSVELVALKTFGERIGSRCCVGHKNHKRANRQSNDGIFQHSPPSKLDANHITISLEGRV